MTRIGDREREQAAARLSAHAAAGRLTVEELEERLERAQSAVYDTDLEELEQDLPGRREVVRREPAPVWRPAWPALPVALLALGIVASIAVGHPVAPLFVGLFFLWRLRWAHTRL
jgi:DUF1707 SHOCT-like domain